MREIEQVLTKLMRIWTPDSGGGVLKTAASVEAERAALAVSESERLEHGGEEEAAVTMVLGPGTATGLGTESNRGGVRGSGGKSAARAEEDDEPVPDERDLAAILALPSPALQAILSDAAAGGDEQEEVTVYYEDYIARIWPAVEASFRKAADVKVALDDAAAAEAATALAAAETANPEETGTGTISSPVLALTTGRRNRAHVAIADIAKNSNRSQSSLPPYGLFDIVLFGDEPERSVFSHVQALIPPPKISLADLAMILPSPQDYQVSRITHLAHTKPLT